MSHKQKSSKAPPRAKDDSAEEEEAVVLRAKIDKLLSFRSKGGSRGGVLDDDDGRDGRGTILSHSAEQALVALVLLTRLDPSRASDTLIRHPRLLEACRAILLSSSNDNEEEATPASPFVVYGRLVAQVIAAACSATGEHQHAPAGDHSSAALLEPLGRLMLELVKNVATAAGVGSPGLSALDADVATALAAFLPRCDDAALVDSLLLHEWHRASVVLRHEREAGGSDSDVDAPAPVTAADRERDNQDPTSPKALLRMTLTAILDQNSWWSFGEGDELRDNLEWWEVQLGALFAEHGCRAAPNSSGAALPTRPSFFVPMLDWWLERKRRRKRDGIEESPLALSAASSYSPSPTTWAQVLLLCLQRSAAAADGGFQDLASDANLSGKVLQLLLACMVSATPDDNLRGQAWFTLSSLIVAQAGAAPSSSPSSGWDWILVDPAAGAAAPPASPGRRKMSRSRSGLGRASKLCALLRMASGEYKIQLNHRMYGARPSLVVTAAGTSEACPQHEDRGSLVDGCGRFLALSLDFIAGLADTPEDNLDNEDDDRPLLLSDVAITHIRKSLREALTCTAQYCSELTAFDARFDLTAVRLFGALLSEFDIFLDRRQDEDDEHAILSALRVVLSVARDREACEGLMPGLLTIFASSEGDESRVSVLKPYLSDLVGFFEFWWSSTSCQLQEEWGSANVEMIECSWSVLELWHDMVVQARVVVEVGGIQREIVKSLSLLLDLARDNENGASRAVKAISSAVSAYTVLQGDEAPSEPDASVIRRSVDVLKRAAS
jgi:hypothetical protein